MVASSYFRAVPGVLSEKQQPKEAQPRQQKAAPARGAGSPSPQSPQPAAVQPWDSAYLERIQAPPQALQGESPTCRTISATALITLVLFHSFHQGAPGLTLLQRLAFWAALLLQAAFPFVTSLWCISPRFRSDYESLLRLLQPAALLLLSLHSGAPAALRGNTLTSYWTFLLHFTLASKGPLLALAALGSGRLPLRRHLALHGAWLAAAMYSSYGTCHEVCAAGSPALAAHFARLLRHLNLLATPALALAGTGADAFPLPATPRFQCWLAWSFQAFLLGALLPTLALYWRELPGLVARRPGGAKAKAAAGDCGLLDYSLTNGAFLLVAGVTLAWVAAGLGAALAEGLVLAG